MLGHYSRDLALFPLETARVEDDRADGGNFGLAGRGTVSEGAHADLVLFDAARIRDAASYEDPARPPRHPGR